MSAADHMGGIANKQATEQGSQKTGQGQGSTVITTFNLAEHAERHEYQGEADISKSLIIKGGNLFMLLDQQGNTDIDTNEAHGLYFHDCRFLSKFTLQLGEQVLVPLLDSDAGDEVAEFELVNSAVMLSEAPGVHPSPPGKRPGQPGGGPTAQPEQIPAQSIGVSRRIHLDDKLEQTISIANFDDQPLHTELRLYFDSDFLDIFTIRGTKGGKRGTFLPPKVDNGMLKLAYNGADQHLRCTAISFDQTPTSLEADKGLAVYQLDVAPRQKWQTQITIELEDRPLTEEAEKAEETRVDNDAVVRKGTLEETPNRPPVPVRQSRQQNKQSRKVSLLPLVGDNLKDFANVEGQPIEIESDNQLFNRVLERSFADLRMLLTYQREDIFFAAGVPWFVTLFGRDSLTTALQTIVYNPSIAAGTLQLLASYQGTHDDQWREEQPGKILHELRVGEKSNLREIPFTPYYGTVDSTPLFLILMGEYLRWTGDYDLFKQLMSNVNAALDWIDKYSERSASGFLEYGGHNRGGLSNQGWKDSGNSIVNSDGKLATPPIALVEVQGYVYKAKTLLAPAFRATGNAETAQRLEHEAAELKDKFNQKFWMPQHNFYAVALQKDEKQVDSIASNPGQALWTGIVPDERASQVRDRLMQSDMFNGWGIRTLSAQEVAYNPFDYQVGAVWPHDNSIIAAGLKNYGFNKEALQVMTAIYNTASLLANYRLPEVFAGVERARESRPVKYPVACRPQAWAAGTVPFMLSSVLGLEPDVPNSTLRVVRPALPDWLPHLSVYNLRVGGKRASLAFKLEGNVTEVRLIEADAGLGVAVIY